MMMVTNNNDDDNNNSNDYDDSTSAYGLRRGIKIPLLDVPEPKQQPRPQQPQPQYQPLVVVPLPSDHLPDALRDLNIYGMELRRPVHKLIMEDAIQRCSRSNDSNKPIYGHLAWKPPKKKKNDSSSSSSLVGAIGCVSEILLHADGDSKAALMGGGVDNTSGGFLETAAQAPRQQQQQGENPSLPRTVVSRGGFRFIVRDVVQTVPFPIAIVDELPDQEPGGTSTSSSSSTIHYDDFANDSSYDDDEDEYDDDDDDDMDATQQLSPSEMMQKLFETLQSYVDQKLEEASNQRLSPLEQAILEDNTNTDDDNNNNMMMMSNPVAVEQARAEQVAATWISFRASLVDVCSTPRERYHAAAFVAAEVVDLPNPVRRKMLTMVDGVQRLAFVLRRVQEAAGMANARKIAQEITNSSDESSKDLKVGTPELPPWSQQIKKGVKVSYYWNEEWEWCEGEVIEDPVMVVDELLVTLRFDDGEVHRLPFHPDEKARWRPPGL